MITYTISVNPEKERNIYSDIEFTSGDIAAYRFCFSVQGIDTNGKTFVIKALRSDGEVIVGSSACASFILPQSMYAVPGEVSFEISVCDGLGSITTVCVITANVREGFGDGKSAEADKFPILKDILNRLQALENAK